MKTIYIGQTPHTVDDAVVDEFMSLRSRQAKLWRRIRTLEDALANANQCFQQNRGQRCLPSSRPGEALVLDGINAFGSRPETTEEENRRLKALLERLFCFALQVKETSDSLVAALKPVHKASNPSAVAFDLIPFEGLKDGSESHKDFIDVCSPNKGDCHVANRD